MTETELKKILREVGHVAEMDLEPTMKAIFFSLLEPSKQENKKGVESQQNIDKPVVNNRPQAFVALPDGHEAKPTDARLAPRPGRLADFYANPNE